MADRAITEGQEADDPYLMAGGAWALVQALRESGRWEEALVVAIDAVRTLDAQADDIDDWHGMRGALLAECALTYARKGRLGQAWQHWESADAVARRHGGGYRHVQSSSSLPVMRAHAVSLCVDLHRGGEALQAVQGFSADEIGSAPRRARHLIEVARAYDQQSDRASTLGTLRSAHRTAPETTRFNGWARQLASGLLHAPPVGESAQVRELARDLQVV